MRLVIFLMLLMPPVFWGSMAWSGGAPEARLTEEDTGKSVSLKVGDRLVLDLRNPASGGYTKISPRYDEQILKLAATREVPPESDPRQRLGDFGRLRLEFEAVGVGQTQLVIHISREWEKDKKPLEYTHNRVTVTR
jgi:predicted secreted protein